MAEVREVNADLMRASVCGTSEERIIPGAAQDFIIRPGFTAVRIGTRIL